MLARARKISFVCHSFGGIICRAALAHEDFKPLLPKLHTLVTLSSPHLGMLYGTNSLVELGIWGLRKFRNAQCLTELSLKDGKTASSSFLYSLSKADVLSHFKNILLVSSIEDRYVPHHSARLQLCREAIADHRTGSTFVSMVHNLLAPLGNCNLLHIEVNFGTKPEAKLMSQLDSAIGRTAHISYLENDSRTCPTWSEAVLGVRPWRRRGGPREVAACVWHRGSGAVWGAARAASAGQVATCVCTCVGAGSRKERQPGPCSPHTVYVAAAGTRRRTPPRATCALLLARAWGYNIRTAGGEPLSKGVDLSFWSYIDALGLKPWSGRARQSPTGDRRHRTSSERADIVLGW
eukprot:1803980-Prymnesium_polylepis.1